MSYKNILNTQIAEFNGYYKKVCKLRPAMSIKEKQAVCFATMADRRELSKEEIVLMALDPVGNCLKFQYGCEVILTKSEIENGIPRYYLKDDSLLDFFKQTEIKVKDVQSIFSSNVFENGTAFGVIGQNFSFLIYVIEDMKKRHFVNVFTDDMNYTFCAEEFNRKTGGEWVFNMAMNFLFYLQAFPECVVDGVPNGVKRNDKAKSIDVSDKVISHRENGERGFVRAHFRSGYFRHLNSDYFVNCKGQVRFIESTMVKGRAKTVLNKEN